MKVCSLALKFWLLSIVISPILWISGFNLFYYQLAAILLSIIVSHWSIYHREGALHIPQTAILLFFYSCVYLISICLNMKGAEAMRIFAAFNNLSFWAAGFLLVLSLSNSFALTQRKKILFVFVILAIWVSIIGTATIFLILKGVQQFSFPTLFYPFKNVFGPSPLIANTVEVHLIGKDWFHQSLIPRVNMFSPFYPSSGAILMIVLIMMSSFFLLQKKMHHWSYWCLLGINLTIFLLTFSRMPVMALIVSVTLVSLYARKHFLMWAFFSLFVFVFLIPVAPVVIDWISSLREGSTELRMKLYLHSLYALNGIEWIFGAGIKKRELSYQFPTGSHSTYIGTLYKTGLVGALTFVTFQIVLLRRWFQLKRHVTSDREDYYLWTAFGCVFWSMSFWMLVGDIDADQFLSFLYFSIVGLFEGHRLALIDKHFVAPRSGNSQRYP